MKHPHTQQEPITSENLTVESRTPTSLLCTLISRARRCGLRIGMNERLQYTEVPIRHSISPSTGDIIEYGTQCTEKSMTKGHRYCDEADRHLRAVMYCDSPSRCLQGYIAMFSDTTRIKPSKPIRVGYSQQRYTFLLRHCAYRIGHRDGRSALCGYFRGVTIICDALVSPSTSPHALNARVMELSLLCVQAYSIRILTPGCGGNMYAERGE